MLKEGKPFTNYWEFWLQWQSFAMKHLKQYAKKAVHP